MNRPMTLGELIATLSRKEPTAEVEFDFVYFKPDGLASWRGDYSELAIGYSNAKHVTVAASTAVVDVIDGEHGVILSTAKVHYYV